MEQNTQTEDTEIDCRKWVWVPCTRELFKPAYILEETQTETRVQSDTRETFSPQTVCRMNPPKFDKIEDLALLSYLNEPSVLHNLRKRYEATQIYTYSGLFLISLNPYRNLGIYTDEIKKEITMKRYRESEPHIFAVANEAYRHLLSDKKNQSILITGESGAGKTENTKRVIEFLSYVASTGMKKSIDTLLVSANPILEAFGNAKTVKNDNSSRFGKFIQLKFRGGDMCAARIEKYLLEKSRVIRQNPGERSYHIFYYLLGGAAPYLLNALGLSGNPADYNCLKDSCFKIDGVDDAAEFARLDGCFLHLGIADPVRYYKLIAAIMHLSNVEFVEADEVVTVKDNRSIEQACRLLDISVIEFLKEVLHPTIKAGVESVVYHRSRDECFKVVEGFMKMIYDSLFERLVFELNCILDTQTSDAFIGVLDIAGFEIFRNNSFEQLCINYTNEKLQQFFNHHMFILEQELYKNESIDWDFIDFGLDLEPTIRIIESNNPIGILSYLDEECVMPRADDTTLLNKIKTIPGIEKCPFTNSFKIKHYAGVVEYEVKEWLNKNKDIHSEKLHSLVSFPTANKSSGNSIKKGIFRTVSQSHRENLKRLMDLLRNTNPHFVRCILPNLNKRSDEFDRKLVLDQLICNGVLEGIRISRLGFPSRVRFNEFNSRYAVLDGRDEDTPIPSSNCRRILESSGVGKYDYSIGNTMVFLKQGVLADIEEQREKKVAEISRIARSILAHKMKLRQQNIEQERKAAIVLLQKNAVLCVEFQKWKWWALFIKIKPLLEVQKNEEAIKEREEQIRAYSELVEKEREERRELESNLAVSKNTLEEQKKSNELMREALKERETLLGCIRSENASLQARVAKDSKVVEAQEERIKQCEVKEENHTRVVRDLNERIERVEAELRDKDVMVARLMEKDGSLAVVLKSKDEEVRMKTERLQMEEKANGELVGKINNMTVEMETLKNEFTEQEKMRSMLESENAGLQSSVKKMKNELDDFYFRNEALESEIRKRDHLLSEAARQMSAVKQEQEYARARADSMETALSSRDERVRELEMKVSEFSALTGDSCETIKALQRQVKTQLIKIGSLESMNVDLVKEKDELYEENQRLAKEKIEMICAADMRVNQERKSLQLEIQRLRAENEKLRADLASGSSSHDDELVERTTKQLEAEKSNRKVLDRRVVELETALVLTQNSVRELTQQLGEAEGRCMKILNETVPRGDVDRVKDALDRIRTDLNGIAEVFQCKYFEVLKRKEGQVDELVERLAASGGEIEALRVQVNKQSGAVEALRVQVNKQSGAVEALHVIRAELEDVLRKNSVLKTELDRVKISQDIDKIRIDEMNEQLERVQQAYGERETVIDSMAIDYNKRVEDVKRREIEYVNKINRLKESDVINAAVQPLAERLAGVVQELAGAERKLAERNVEIARLCSLLENEKETGVGQVAVQERERLVVTSVVDKELLRALERRKLVSCNCGLQSKVKVVEVAKDSSEELLRLENEKSVLEMKLKQAERLAEEQGVIIEGMKGCVAILKRKVK